MKENNFKKLLGTTGLFICIGSNMYIFSKIPEDIDYDDPIEFMGNYMVNINSGTPTAISFPIIPNF